ncbi:MAG: hypothetical protein R3F47_01480 [Gammaproteobacteria bacterium]
MAQAWRAIATLARVEERPDLRTSGVPALLRRRWLVFAFAPVIISILSYFIFTTDRLLIITFKPELIGTNQINDHIAIGEFEKSSQTCTHHNKTLKKILKHLAGKPALDIKAWSTRVESHYTPRPVTQKMLIQCRHSYNTAFNYCSIFILPKKRSIGVQYPAP